MLQTYRINQNVGTYINGNYSVSVDSWGTKTKRALRVGEPFMPVHPDSIDLKITNSCSWGCPFCHENSVPGGKSFDWDRTTAFLEELPKVGIEVAVGGGDILDDWETTWKFIGWLKKNKFLPRITLSYKDYEKYEDLRRAQGEYTLDKDDPRKDLCELMNEITKGVSIMKYEEDPLPEKYAFFRSAPIVYHVIIGVLPPGDLLKMYEARGKYKRILVLGYKSFGRAQGTGVPRKVLQEWRDMVRTLIERSKAYYTPSSTIGFDNLAIEQLGLRDVFTDEEWDLLYQGDEFTSSMFVDAVEETVAPTSRTPKEQRIPWNECGGILKYFKDEHNR